MINSDQGRAQIQTLFHAGDCLSSSARGVSSVAPPARRLRHRRDRDLSGTATPAERSGALTVCRLPRACRLAIETPFFLPFLHERTAL